MEEDADTTEMWLTWNDHSDIMRSVLSTLRYKALYADVTLVCGTKQFPVHRFVLATCSAYFEQLLATIPGNHPVVVLTNTSPKDLAALLDFMYLGQAEVSSLDLDRLLDIAYEFRIRGLISARDDPEKQVPVEETYEPEEVSDSVKRDPEPVEYPPEYEMQDLETERYEDFDAHVPVGEEEPLQVKMESQVEDDLGEHSFNGFGDSNIEKVDEGGIEPKVEEDVKPTLGSGLQEYQNFILKRMQENDDVDSTIGEVTPVSSPEKSFVTKKISKSHHEDKVKKFKSKSKLEHLKDDSKKHKEKLKFKLENSKEKIKSGKSSEDTKTKIMMCPGCKKTFMSQSVLEEHMKTHEDLEIVSCVKCPYKALSQQQMQKHMASHQQRIEQQNRPYPCPYCPARQADKTSHILHQKTLHPDKKNFHDVMNAKVVLEDCRIRTKC